MAANDGAFCGLSAVIASAATAVAGVFCLFESVLSELVPPFEESEQTVGFVSLLTVVTLLALSLVIRGRLKASSVKTLALISVALGLLSALVFFPFRDLTRTYVYRYPPSSAPSKEQSRHIRGDLSQKGREFVKSMTVAEAVYRLGGPDHVNSSGTMWPESSRRAVIDKMERYYVALVALVTTAIFTAGLAVWRLTQQGRKERGAKRE